MSVYIEGLFIKKTRTVASIQGRMATRTALSTQLLTLLLVYAQWIFEGQRSDCLIRSSKGQEMDLRLIVRAA